MFKKLLVLFLLIILILTGCSVTREKLLPQMDKKLQKLDGYYAEMEAVVFSTEGEQTYQIKQWLELPSKWRVEVTTGEDAQHFISDGKQIWVCQPGIGDYYRMDANSQSEELAAPFMLTGYLRQLQQAADFQFTDNDDVFVVTYPGHIEGETVRMKLNKKTLFPERIEVILDEKTVSRLTVTKLQLDPEFDAGLFEFTAAADQEVSALCDIHLLTLEEAKKGWPAPVFMPSYLPDGTSLYTISRVMEEDKEQLIFIYQGSTSFTFVQCHNTKKSMFQSEKAKDVQIGSLTGSYQQNSTNDLTTLYWSHQEGSFILTGSMPLAELVKIAKSLQPDGV